MGPWGLQKINTRETVGNPREGNHRHCVGLCCAFSPHLPFSRLPSSTSNRKTSGKAQHIPTQCLFQHFPPGICSFFVANLSAPLLIFCLLFDLLPIPTIFCACVLFLLLLLALFAWISSFWSPAGLVPFFLLLFSWTCISLFFLFLVHVQCTAFCCHCPLPLGEYSPPLSLLFCFLLILG